MIYLLNPHIFDNATQTKMAILEIISKAPQWYSAEKLANLTNSEKKTILKYTNELINEIQQFNHGDLTIQTKKSKGIFLQYSDEKVLTHFRLFIIENTFTIQLMKQLFFNYECSLTQLSQQYFLSESTIRRKIAAFNTIIEVLGIKIIARNKNYSLQGDESQIRMLSYICFWAIYKGNIWPFPMVDENKLILLTDELLKHLTIPTSSLNIIDQKMFRYILAINIIRFHQGNEIQENKKWQPYLNFRSFSALEQQLKTDVHLSQNEVKYFFLVVQTFTKTYEYKTLGNQLFQEQKYFDTPAYRTTKEFFSLFQKEFEYVFSEEQYLAFFGFVLASHLFCDLFYGFSIGISGYNNFEDMQLNYPQLTSKINHLIEQLQEVSQINLLFHKKFLQTVYSLVYSSIATLTKYERSILIYLESDLPKFAEKLIIKDIQLTFQNKFNLKFFSDDWENTTKTGIYYDLILSNSTLPSLNQSAVESPIIHINTPLTSQDYSNIHRTLKTILN